MSDAAAFFAKKKGKKKKVFKFNANNVDASQVTSTVHVDAPAVSSETQVPSLNSLSIAKSNDGGGDWDEAKATVKPSSTAPKGSSAELMDMKALELKRNEQDDIAERMRVEETKAKLAAAREGMEKEAQRLKDEKEFQEVKKRERKETAASNRFGAAASNLGGAMGNGSGSGSKWVPPHLRNAGSSASARAPTTGPRFGAAMGNVGYQRKVDTNDEELFPDLATADKLIAKEEEERQAAVAAARKAKAPSSSGAVWGAKKATKQTDETAVEEETKLEPEPEKEEPKPPAAPAPAPAPKKKVVKKKKKKDLSTFKVS